jgi:glycolate oxidase iron-sulfur subunit
MSSPSAPTPLERLRTPEAQALLDQCIHCGLCLPACPTYTLLGTETDSPRGRISLIRAAAQGRIDLEGAFQEHIGLCLACRSCETACPSGVQYGALVEMARVSLEESRQPGLAERFIRWVGLKQLMPHLGRLKVIARLGRVYQRTFLPRFVRRMTFLPERLRLMEGMLPEIQTDYASYRQPALALGERQGAVAFFHGCIQEALLAGVNQATVRVLQRSGWEVHFPQAQTCCGAAQLHVGELSLAKELARRNIDAFFASQPAGEAFTALINNAGGCGATLKEYAHLLADDPVYASRAAVFVSKVRDISEFLDTHMTVPPQGAMPITAAYSDSCHLRHAQKVAVQPRRLLRSIPGLELIELKRPDHCCGSAGVYNLVHTEEATGLLDRKMDDIAATGADWIVTSNTGCYMQLVYGVRRRGSAARVAHVVELLDESYRREDARDPKL